MKTHLRASVECIVLTLCILCSDSAECDLVQARDKNVLTSRQCFDLGHPTVDGCTLVGVPERICANLVSDR